MRACVTVAVLGMVPLGSCAGGDDGPELVITPFVGASVQIEYGETVIHVDPWSRGDYSNAEGADLILVTDTPADHLDPELIAKLRKPGAPVVLSDRP